MRRNNTLYEITDRAELLREIRDILSGEDTLLLGEGYETYPVLLY